MGTASVATANESEHATTIPDNGPAYGVNSSDFYRLWSNDVVLAFEPRELNGLYSGNSTSMGGSLR
ncbi:hypothetical protein [Natrinema ejinorense]|uniref:Uncharacterized protein n=1 Tax=Natrinema ejinorense TaxID=373386 RepID=A0A2A5QU20_9EURY|nr:hypothetical protein [Natrinema ejinorense]PCR90305.1 hypothetical protein CP557_06990 [Natrinema ejinorense]